MKLTSLKTLFKRPFFSFLKEVFSEWQRHGTLVEGAALAFYTIISLPTLLLALIGIAGFLVNETTARESLVTAVQSIAGSDPAQALGVILAYSTTSSENILRFVVGGVLLFFNITGLFSHLQAALNKIWNIKPKEHLGWGRKILSRLIAFGSFLLIAAVFASSILVNGFISKADKLFYFLHGNRYIGLLILSLISNAIIFTLLFALLFRILPDAKTKYKDVIIGGAITTLLFLIGEGILTVYFHYSSLGSSYGITGSLVILMLWIYYSAQIIFIGAEITHQYAQRYGEGVKAEEYAEKK